MPSAELETEKLNAPREQPVLPAIGRTNRAHFLDLLRGTAMIYVMVYHLCYDLIYFGGISLPFFFTAGWEAAHKFFLVLLFGVSGVCAGFSGNVLKRGAELYLLGWLITFGSALFVPDETIVFGVLSCFGMTMLIYGIASPALKKLPNGVLFAVFSLLAVIFFDFSHGSLLFGLIHTNLPRDILWLYPIGIMSADFYSSDYFPLVPYSFVFLAGTALSDAVKSRALPEFFYKAKLPVINFCGRYSLWLYIIHQPLFLGTVMLLFK